MEHNYEDHSSREVTKNNQRTFTLTSKQLLIACLVVVALLAIIWTWKSIQINSLKKDHSEHTLQLKQQAQTMLISSDKHYLQLLAKPYVWAIRTEMMKGNLSQVHLYANDMVKEKNMKSVVVADNKGVVVSSTDKKLEGQNFAAVGNQAYLSIDNTVVEQVNDSLLVMATPVMGFNSRLGTLMISYSPIKPVFK
jgi:hypothetical protein